MNYYDFLRAHGNEHRLSDSISNDRAIHWIGSRCWTKNLHPFADNSKPEKPGRKLNSMQNNNVTVNETSENSPISLGVPEKVAIFIALDKIIFSGDGIRKIMEPIDGEVFLNSAVDSGVRLMLTNRALVVTYTDPYVTTACLPDGSEIKEVVQETIAIGYVNHDNQGEIHPCFWRMQYIDDSLLPEFGNEIVRWWESLPTERRNELLTKFDCEPKILW